MWLFTTFGFFSATEVRDGKPRSGEQAWPAGTLQVRARCWEDLENLREKYLPELSETIHIPGRDYPYRGYCSKSEFAAAMVAATLDIDYSNFKNKVKAEQGPHRADLYGDIWHVMYRAEEKIANEERKEEERRQRSLPLFRNNIPEYLEPWIEDAWRRDAEAEADRRDRETTEEIDFGWLYDDRSEEELEAAAERTEAEAVAVLEVDPLDVVSDDPEVVQETMARLGNGGRW
jgi:hypothetical protein